MGTTRLLKPFKAFHKRICVMDFGWALCELPSGACVTRSW